MCVWVRFGVSEHSRKLCVQVRLRSLHQKVVECCCQGSGSRACHFPATPCVQVIRGMHAASICITRCLCVGPNGQANVSQDAHVDLQHLRHAARPLMCRLWQPTYECWMSVVLNLAVLLAGDNQPCSPT